MDRARSVGSVRCNVCMEEFQTTINYLSETVDVYADWIDACEKANEWFSHDICNNIEKHLQQRQQKEYWVTYFIETLSYVWSRFSDKITLFVEILILNEKSQTIEKIMFPLRVPSNLKTFFRVRYPRNEKI